MVFFIAGNIVFKTYECIVIYFATLLNPFKPEFTIVIFIHYKPRIAVAVIDL